MNTAEKVLQEAEALSKRAEQAIQELEERRAELLREIQALRPYVKKSSTNGGHSKKTKHEDLPSIATMTRVASALYQMEDGHTFSTTELCGATNLHSTTIGKAIKALREERIIRLAECKRVGNAVRATNFFRVKDREALVRMLRDNES